MSGTLPTVSVLYCGIDEAGYGPMLGPLTVGLAVFAIDAWETGDPAPDLWDTLSRAVCRQVRGSGQRIPIADSKKLKLSNDGKRHPCTHLERGVLTALAALGSTLRVPPVRCSAAANGPSKKALYAQIDSVLRRAREKEGADRMSAQVARSLGNRWLEMEPEDLVEATLVSGNLVLQGFDEGLAILCEAEDNADLHISGKAYSALMRLAQTEERPMEALQLLARTRAYDVERTDGLLLSAMRAAAALEDWGAVARLYAELCDGPEAATLFAGTGQRENRGRRYPHQPMSAGVYPVHGGMEDWAYAASWDAARLTGCTPSTHGGYRPERTALRLRWAVILLDHVRLCPDGRLGWSRGRRGCGEG